MLPFNDISRKSIPEIVLSNLFSKLCKQGGKLDYNRYSQISLLTYVITSKLIFIRYGDLPKITISLCNTLHTLFQSTVACHSN